MFKYIKTNVKVLQYWVTIMLIITMFGSAMGYLGVVRMQHMPGLVVIDPAIKGQLNKLDTFDNRITNLDTRITVLERHATVIDTTNLTPKPKKK